jgi:hypothetical protein
MTKVMQQEVKFNYLHQHTLNVDTAWISASSLRLSWNPAKGTISFLCSSVRFKRSFYPERTTMALLFTFLCTHITRNLVHLHLDPVKHYVQLNNK